MWVSFVPFIYVAGYAFWIWRQKGTKFTLRAESRVLEERLSHGEVMRESSPVSNEKDGKSEGLEQVEYRV